MPLNPYANEWTPSIIFTAQPPTPSPSPPKSNRKQRTRRKKSEGKLSTSKAKDDKSSSSIQIDDFPSLTQTNPTTTKDTSKQQLTYLELAQKQLTQPPVSSESVNAEPVGWFSSRSCRRWDNINKSSSAVDSSSSDDDDIVISVECTALIPEQQQQQQTVSLPLVEYPRVCQTIANKNALARWKQRWQLIAKQQSDRIKSQMEEKEQQQKNTTAAAAATGSSSNSGTAWHGALRLGLVSQSFPYATNPDSVITAERQRVTFLPQYTADEESPLSMLVDKSPTTVWWTAVLSGDAGLLQRLLQLKHSQQQGYFETTFLIGTYQINSSQFMDVMDMHIEEEKCMVLLIKSLQLSDQWPQDGLNAVHVAAQRGHAAVLELLLQQQSSLGGTSCCDVDAKDRTNKATALLFAAESGHIECAKILVDRFGADVECRDRQHETALHKAARISNTSLVKWLCDKACLAAGGRVGVNAKNKRKETPLMLARTREVAVILIASGADPTAYNVEGLSAACMAARRGDARLLEALVMCNTNAFGTHAHRGVGGTTDNILSRTRSAGRMDMATSSPLHEACTAGSLSCVRLLLTDRHRSCSSRINGSSINECDGTSRRLTPLMRACVKCHHAIVEELLLVHDCDVNVEDAKGNTALVLAAVAATGSSEKHGLSCVRALLRIRPVHRHISALGECVLEAVVRASRDDQRPSDHVPGSFVNTSSSTDRTTKGTLPLTAIAEIVAAGGSVTERFIRRLGGVRTGSLLKLVGFKIVSAGANDRTVCSGKDDLPSDLDNSTVDFSKRLRRDSSSENPHQRRSVPRSSKNVTLQIPCSTVDLGGNRASSCPHMWSTVPWLLPIDAPDPSHCDVEFNLDSATLLAHSFVVSRESPLLGSLITQLRSQQHDRLRVSGRVCVDCTQHSASAFMRMVKWMYTREDPGPVLDPAAVCELLLLANELLVTPLQHLCEGIIVDTVQLYDRPSLLRLCDALGLCALRLQIDRGSTEPFGKGAWQGLEQTIVEAHKNFSFSSTVATTSPAMVLAAARRLFAKSTSATMLIGSPPIPSPSLAVDEEVVGRIVAGTDAAKLRIHGDSHHSRNGRQTQGFWLEKNDESSMDEYACACLCAAPIAMARELLRMQSCDGSPSADHRHGWQEWLNSRYGEDRCHEGTIPSTNDNSGARNTSKPAVLRQMELRLGWLLDSTAYDVILIVACSNAETTAAEKSSSPDSISILAHKAILSAATGKLAAMIRFEAHDDDSSTSSPSSSSISQAHQQINRTIMNDPLVLRLDAVGGLNESDVREMLWQAYTGTLPPASVPSSVFLQASALTQNSDEGRRRKEEEAKEEEEEEEEEIDHLLRLLWVADEFLAARWTLSLVRRLFRQIALSPHCAGSVFMASKVLCNATLCSGQTDDDAAISIIKKEMDMLVAVSALMCVLTCSHRNDNHDGDYKVVADEEELLIDAIQTLTD